jgi:hypothetical protein
MALIMFAPSNKSLDRQPRRWPEELGHVFRLSIRDEQNIRADSDLRELCRALLFRFSFVNDGDSGSIGPCRGTAPCSAGFLSGYSSACGGIHASRGA